MKKATRKDSITGKMHSIGGFNGPVKRDSFHGVGLGFRRDKREKEPTPDEMDDIEILEQLVHERVEFDWDKFAREREQSVYIKENQRNKKKASTLKNSRMDFEKYKINSGGAVERLEVGSDLELDNDEEDMKSVVSMLLGGDNCDDLIARISTDAKAKLKFIIEFATSKPNKMSKQSSKIMRNLDPNDLVRLRQSILQTRLGREANRKMRQSRVGRKKQNSAFSARSASIHNFEERSTKIDANPKETRARNADEFAKYKGFKDAETMKKHLERVRGFEELKNETQIDLMARENGYKPSRTGRMQSVLSYLDSSVDKTKAVDVEDGVENMEKALDELKEKNEDSDMSDDGEFLGSDFESDSDDESEICAFMDLDVGDGDLNVLMDKWEGFDVDEEKPKKKMTASAAVRARKREKMRKRAVRRGWDRTKVDTENDFVHRRLRPYDSLTTRHMKELQIAEEQDGNLTE